MLKVSCLGPVKVELGASWLNGSGFKFHLRNLMFFDLMLRLNKLQWQVGVPAVKITVVVYSFIITMSLLLYRH